MTKRPKNFVRNEWYSIPRSIRNRNQITMYDIDNGPGFNRWFFKWNLPVEIAAVWARTPTNQ